MKKVLVIAAVAASVLVGSASAADLSALKGFSIAATGKVNGVNASKDLRSDATIADINGDIVAPVSGGSFTLGDTNVGIELSYFQPLTATAIPALNGLQYTGGYESGDGQKGFNTGVNAVFDANKIVPTYTGKAKVYAGVGAGMGDYEASTSTVITIDTVNNITAPADVAFDGNYKKFDARTGLIFSDVGGNKGLTITTGLVVAKTTYDSSTSTFSIASAFGSTDGSVPLNSYSRLSAGAEFKIGYTF